VLTGLIFGKLYIGIRAEQLSFISTFRIIF